MAAHDIAALLVRLAPADERTTTSRLKAIAPAVQQAGTAMLVDGHVGLVARAGADGVHVSGVEAMQDALPLTKSGRMVGVGGLHTRHDAMVAGEAGADYVLFGEPGQTWPCAAPDAIYDRLQWWAEVFEPP
ncbi:MAG: thiamine phosphate synthase [Pseudomonas sp.]